MSTPAEARLANLLGAAATGVTDAMEQSMLAADGLDGTGRVALVALLDFSPNGSVRALSRIVGLTHAGAVRLVDRLADAGYVERAPGSDARSLTLTLTATGAALARRLRAARESALVQAIGQLSDDQRSALGEICEHLIGSLTELRLEQRAAGGDPAGGALCRLCDFGACGRHEGECPAAQAAAAVLTEKEGFEPSTEVNPL